MAAQNVIFPVAGEDRAGKIVRAVLPQDPSHDIDLLPGLRILRAAAADARKILQQVKMRQYLPRHGLELRGRDVHPLARALQRLQAFPHAGIRLVFEPAGHAVVFPEPVDGRGDLFLRQILAERLPQRRADKIAQLLLAQAVNAERLQRSLRRVHDARPGVRQRSVQIKQKNIPAHRPASQVF